MEKEDLSLYTEWVNDPEFYGPFINIQQRSKAKIEKYFETLPENTKWFLIEKSDGDKIGYILYWYFNEHWEIGYGLAPSERGKGFSTEAVQVLLDFLFLSRDLVRVQAHADVENVASQKVLEKSGFSKEGTVRKSTYALGKWRDEYLYSILREEWEKPKILTKIQ
jgi:RimJ/RimL family protein N-acetyltransferase